MRGRVIKSTGSWYEVRLESDAQIVKARLLGKFKLDKQKVTNPIAVGDYVTITKETDEGGHFLIQEIEERSNYIIRKSVHKTAHGHIIAANLDQAICIASLTMPRTSLGFIDRFLVASESFRIPAYILFNKWDLLKEQQQEDVLDIAEMYDSIGYKVIIASIKEGKGLNDIEALLKGKTTLLSGHSGVGKSSLVNYIKPGLALSTKEVSKFANKGVHTTTFAQMFEIAEDTFIVDTPGIKELGMVDMENDPIAHYFPEMRVYMNKCKYHNCTHTNEPGCAVLSAIEAGEIPESRYLSYLSILEGDDNRR